jgi:kynurenine formamidase
MRPIGFALVCALLLAAACAGPRSAVEEPAAAPLPSLDAALSAARVVDLTYAYDADTVYWPTDTNGFQLEQLAYGTTDAGFFYAANAFATAEHGGTHLDAPIHFAADRWTAEAIPLDRLIGPAVVIDVADQAAADRDYELTELDVEAWEAEHGAIAEGAIVLLRTGWGRYWPDRARYLGDDTPGDASNLHFPSYGADAARGLVEARKVAVLGVDTASIDPGTSTDFWVHRIANEANVPGLENVANLGELPPTGAWIVALPMKIAGGSGAPARIVALLPAD